MSILFADIRSFRDFTELLDLADDFPGFRPDLSWVEPAILENEGFIDKYTGDTIVALFESADDAVNAGIQIYNILADYNQHRQENHQPPIDIGIGIHTGFFELETANIAYARQGRMVKHDVNLVTQIQKLTQSYGVSLFISHHTLLKLDDITYYNLRFIDRVQVEDKSDMVTIYEIFDVDSPEICQLKALTKTEFEQALVLYNMRHFHKAALLFEDCLSTNPQDQAAQIYLQRCQEAMELQFS